MENPRVACLVHGAGQRSRNTAARGWPPIYKCARCVANENQQARDEVRRSCGLVRVRGNLGGVYWE